jgi:hypothetical protein
VLVLVAVAGVDPAWLLAPALSVVKLEHHATVSLVGQIIHDGRWPILLCSGLFVALGTLSVAYVIRGRAGRVPLLLALIFVVGSWFTHITVLPVVAQTMSYRAFVRDVRGLVTGGSDLGVWDTDVPVHQLVFYYGGRIRVLDDRPALVRALRSADAYVIMSEASRRRLLAANVRTPVPILRTGPVSGTPLVLVRGRPDAEIGSDDPGPGAPSEPAARRPRLTGVDRQSR